LQNKCFSLLLLIFSLLVCFASCNKGKGRGAEEGDLSQDGSSLSDYRPDENLHIYHFSRHSVKDSDQLAGGVLKEIVAVDKCPECEGEPWTDSVRISGMGFLAGSNFIEGEPCFVLNRLGVFSFKNALTPPINYASNEGLEKASLGNLYNTDIGLLLHSYKMHTFQYIDNSQEDVVGNEELAMLSRYNAVTQELESILFPHHFALPSYATLSSLHYNNGWKVSFKIDSGKEVEFRYFAFNNMSDILNAEYTQITQEAFRSSAEPIREGSEAYSLLPQGLIQLINSTEEENISIEYFDKNYPASLKILKTSPKAPELEDIDCSAVAYSSIDKEKVHYSILFASGKLYIYYVDDKFPDVYLLPELPENFAYTYFAVHNGFVVAAWEEQEFYECKRTGLLTSPLKSLKKLVP